MGLACGDGGYKVYEAGIPRIYSWEVQRNYMINTGTKDEKRMYAWEYSREDLKIILQMIDDVIKSKE